MAEAKCQKCASARVACVTAKSSDMATVSVGKKSDNGYLPGDMGIGGGDYVEFAWCLECGQIQGAFPLPPTSIETGKGE